jgi:23S rRNA pseudouridine1911/1915/1917 synthase
VLLIAKSQEQFDFLKEKFQNRKIQKEYRAIVTGVFKDDNLDGIIYKKIGKSPSDFRKWSAQPGARGNLRDAITEYKVLETKGAGNDGCSYISAFPKTGRTHQIRVHFKAIHHAILGDKLYGTKNNLKIKAERTMLHSYKIEFTDKENKKREYIADLPADFKKVLNKCFDDKK